MSNSRDNTTLSGLGSGKPSAALSRFFQLHIAAVLSIIFAAVFTVALPSHAQDSAIGIEQYRPLDGKTFKGEIGLIGEPAIVDESVTFKDGKFVSAECERRCGYSEGDYWLRFEGDVIYFKTRSYCERADAWIDWVGEIKGQDIVGTLTWTSQRWYWTTEKDFWFQGNLVDIDQ